MYVCICQGVTQRDIQNAVEDGLTFSDIHKKMGVGSDCGSCNKYAKQLVKQTQQEMRMLEQLAYAV